MKANQLFNKILDKWPVKVCCLILAICLFLFHQASLTEKRSFVIPLAIEEDGAVVHTGDYVSNVTVVVRANTEAISSVHSNELYAYVSLNGVAKNGEYNLPVRVKVSDEILAFDPFEVKVKPEYIKIKAEKKEMRYIPVSPSVVGEPAHGYEVTDVKTNPSVLEVTGPATIIENTNKIYTEKIDVDGLTKKESFKVDYKAINKLLSVKTDDQIEVTVMIEPQSMERIIEGIEVSVLFLNEALTVMDGPAVVTVKLSGTVPVLENYIPGKRFVTVDMSKITQAGEYDLPLVYTVPAYLTLEEKSNETIHLIVMDNTAEQTALEEHRGEE